MNREEESWQKGWPKEMRKSGSSYFNLFIYPLLDMWKKETEMLEQLHTNTSILNIDRYFNVGRVLVLYFL